MLQLYSDGRVIVGLTALNVNNLIVGLPISFALARGASNIVIFYGHDKKALLRQLDDAGIVIEQAVREGIEGDPA